MGMEAYQSRTLGGYEAAKAVDGDPDTCSYSPRGRTSTTGRRNTRGDWWQVDLGDTYDVTAVGIAMTPGEDFFSLFEISPPSTLGSSFDTHVRDTNYEE
jgi:hypothetical protein